MRRYTNWGFIFLGTVLAALGVTSSWWVPPAQDWLVEEEQTDIFPCEPYLQNDECNALRDLYRQDPERAQILSDNLNPDNDIVADDPGPVRYAEILGEGSSDPPSITTVRTGEFIRIDPIRKAEGTATIYEIITFDGARSVRIVRFEGILSDPFRVTRGLEPSVYLSQSEEPRTRDQLFAEGLEAFELGTLKGNVGPQDYEIPPEVDLTQYESIVIYDKALDLIFSVANLSDIEGISE